MASAGRRGRAEAVQGDDLAVADPAVPALAAPHLDGHAQDVAGAEHTPLVLLRLPGEQSSDGAETTRVATPDGLEVLARDASARLTSEPVAISTTSGAPSPASARTNAPRATAACRRGAARAASGA